MKTAVVLRDSKTGKYVYKIDPQAEYTVYLDFVHDIKFAYQFSSEENLMYHFDYYFNNTDCEKYTLEIVTFLVGNKSDDN